MKKIDYKRLFICILLTFLIGALPKYFYKYERYL